MKKFSPPQMKEVSFPTPHTPHPTPSFKSGVSPDEKIFTPTDERGFLPYTPHPTPYTLFQVRSQGRNRYLIR
jgi:hypothetical protein